jgi:hypothetical protein
MREQEHIRRQLVLIDQKSSNGTKGVSNAVKQRFDLATEDDYQSNRHHDHHTDYYGVFDHPLPGIVPQ